MGVCYFDSWFVPKDLISHKDPPQKFISQDFCHSSKENWRETQFLYLMDGFQGIFLILTQQR